MGFWSVKVQQSQRDIRKFLLVHDSRSQQIVYSHLTMPIIGQGSRSFSRTGSCYSYVWSSNARGIWIIDELVNHHRVYASLFISMSAASKACHTDSSTIQRLCSFIQSLSPTSTRPYPPLGPCLPSPSHSRISPNRPSSRRSEEVFLLFLRSWLLTMSRTDLKT